jgi:ATP-dependent Clp protease protease subunit
LTNRFIINIIEVKKVLLIKKQNMYSEFDKYAVKHLGVNSNTLHDYQKFNATAPGIQASVTPSIIEERPMNMAVMSVFDRLMMDRIIWCAGPVDDRMALIVQAQLLFLNQQDPTKMVTIHVDSPGGSVKAGLSMVDVMDYVKGKGTEIQTINTGMAASMGSVLLGAGTKGMRSSLRFSRTMLHQSSGGAGGNIQDARIMMTEWEKINETLFELLGEYCGKDAKQVAGDASRDLWLSSKEALDYGIIDEIL